MKTATGLVLSPFHQYELPNAVRLSVFRGLRDAAAGEAILAAFEADLGSGHFDVPTCNLASVLIEAQAPERQPHRDRRSQSIRYSACRGSTAFRPQRVSHL